MWLASPSHATALQATVVLPEDDNNRAAAAKSTPSTIRVGILDRVSTDGWLWGLRSGGRALTHATAIAETLANMRVQIDLRAGDGDGLSFRQSGQSDGIGRARAQWSPKLEVDVVSFSQHTTSFEEQAR